LSQTDRHKSPPGKKARKAPGEATPSPLATAALQPRDAAQKQAVQVHSGLQDLNRRTGELETQVGELDAELKRTREALRAAEERATESAAKAARAVELEQEVGRLRKQLDRMQIWSAEMSDQAAELRDRAEKAAAAEKAARLELEKTHEHHDTVVRAKDEKVAALESRAKEGLKRLKDAHDWALRDEATRATAAEKQAREDLRKLQELHETMIREAGPLRSQVAELRAQAEKAVDLRKDIDALSQQVGQAVGAREKTRRELDEVRDLLQKTREDLRQAQDLRGESDRGSDALRTQIADLQKDLAALRDVRDEADRDRAALRTKADELERKLREASQEDSRLAPLRQDLKSTQDARDAALREVAALREQLTKTEAKSAESARYFQSIENELVGAQARADKADDLRAELDRMKEECHDHEEGLNLLSETVMELQYLLDESATKAAPLPPKVEAAPPPVKVAIASPPPPAPVVQAPPPPPPAPKPEPVKVEIDLPPPAPPPPASKPEPIKVEIEPPPVPPVPARVAVPAPVSVPAPASASNETTLRTNNTFGPNGADGQPKYLLHEMLPKDAMGVVYRATERASGRAFAVRFMAGQAGEEQTQAFEREVEKLISLPHPNLLRVQGTGRRKNRLYVMMDLVEGSTLGASKISEIPRICSIVRDAASAVNYANEEGIFHGDLNPESIVVSKEGGKDFALVRDFGLARLLETQAGSLRNPAFLPPEQVRVLKSPLSAAVDVYGLGATLFAALTGRAPFEGKDAAQIAKRVMIEEPPPVEKFRADVPKAVSAVVRRAMAKERGVRYASAQEMADALSKFLDAR